MLNWSKWFKLFISLIFIISLLIGVLLGYLIYANDSCSGNPFTYGVNILNEKNEDNIMCSCYSQLGITEDFCFDESGMRNDCYGIN